MEAQQLTNNTPRSADDNVPRSDDDNAPRSDDDNVPRSADTQRHVTFMSDTDDEEEEGEEEEIVLLRTEDECNEEKHQTPSPTMHLDTPPSHDILCEEEEDPAGNRLVCHPTGKQDGAEEAGTEVEDTCLSKGEEDYGICSPEELLQETVDRLKTGLETDRWKEMQTCESYID